MEELFQQKELVDKSTKHVRVVGAAGIGKTTLCQRIAYLCSQERLWPQFQAILWVKFRNLTETRYPGNVSYREILAQECHLEKETLENALQDETFTQETLLICDGYDEFTCDRMDPQEGSIAYAYQELKDTFPNILLTTRPVHTHFESTINLEILGFDKKSTACYIDHFFQEQAMEDRGEKLKASLEQNPLMSSLAHIPINLSMMCALIKEEAQGP